MSDKGDNTGTTKQASQGSQFNPNVNRYSNLAASYLAPAFGKKVTGTTQGEFDASRYLTDNPDVAGHQDFKNDPWRHWTEHGKAEGRSFPGEEVPMFGDPEPGETQAFGFPDTSGIYNYAKGKLEGNQATNTNIQAHAGAIPSRLANLNLRSSAPTVDSAAAAAQQELNRGPLPYNELAKRQLDAMRPSYGARGMAGSGVAAGYEADALRDLNVDLALQEAATRDRSIRTLADVGGAQQSVYSQNTQDELLRSGGELSSLATLQGLVSKGDRDSLDNLKSAAEIESMPFDKLISLINAQRGGQSNESTQSKTSQPSPGGGISVVCTELHRQGKLPHRAYLIDSWFGKQLPENVLRGYHSFGRPLARLMSKSRVATRLLTPVIRAWTSEIVYRCTGRGHSNWLGRWLLIVGIPVCKQIGRESRWTKAVVA